MTETHNEPVSYFVNVGGVLVDLSRVISVEDTRGRRIVSLDAMPRLQTVLTTWSLDEVQKALNGAPVRVPKRMLNRRIAEDRIAEVESM